MTNVFDWANAKTDELGADLAATIQEASDEALLDELAAWLNTCASTRVIGSLQYLANKLEGLK